MDVAFTDAQALGLVVLRLIAAGKTNAEVATDLGVVPWRGFRSLGRAKVPGRPGGRIDCSSGSCEITPAEGVAV